ncbi:hypothetical protein CHLRE_16g663876v5 [Chlamydomonas reinhardtii]|uniref:RCC1-like domain-containing protein n=1 Tax=Chlamydomonas reinhardtii TaxID=3055 RepID=A0A2K3CTQ4_CHLRE|nr:uncharacterized protein CHLRE_16g663876v5 [Chlamydomonas reinhardtii]PNW71667.1 hypothetical protein CHLRE_16g663876v5 [Chlamydomonas reinhardtii]
MHRLLVAFGNADHGRLGLGATTLSSVMTPRVNLALARYDLENLAAGGAHTVVVTRGGLVFTFGLNTRGQLGHSAEADSAAEPGNVLLPEPVAAVAAGDAHTACLTESGRVYTFGCNASGQLGVGRDAIPGGRSHSARPMLVEALTGQRVVSVAAGAAHSLAVTDSGRLYAWGLGDHGRLGLGPPPSAASSSNSSCGSDGSSDSSSDRTSSSSSCSEGGGARSPWVEWLPRAVTTAALGGSKPAEVFAGPATSACMDEAGRVYTWGFGALHQLGHGAGAAAGGGGRATPDDEWEPRLVDVSSLRRTRRLALGGAHALACRTDERVHVWGSDPSGIGSLGMMPGSGLGLGPAPGPLPGSAVVIPAPTIFRWWFTDVAAGLAHSAGVSSDGKLFAWGWGGAVSSAGALQLPRLAAPGQEEAYSPRGGPQVRLRLGGGQLGVGSGVNLPSPTLVTKLEILPGEVFRQDGGDPFNYQDSNLGWIYRRVACGPNHTVALIQVARSWTQAISVGGRWKRPGQLPSSGS